MAIFDILKRKKKEEKPEVVRKPVEKPVEEPKEIKKETIEAPKKERKIILNEAGLILKTPHISEKATDFTKKNQYIFNVYSRANKIEIKKAIESVYGVAVTSVKIVNVPRKRRRLGKISGWRKGYKKAVVKIKKGQKIEILPH